MGKNKPSTQVSKSDTTASGPGKAKKRRWLKVLIIAIAVVLVLIFISPYILSTSMGAGWTNSIINSYSEQKIDVKDISLSWLGPIRVEGVRMWDRQEREIVQVERVSWSKGLFGAMAGAMSFAELDIEGPAGTVYLTADDGVSTPEEKSGRNKTGEKKESGEKTGEKQGEKKTDKRSSTSLPKPKGTLKIQAGKLTLVNPDGKRVEIEKIDGNVKLDTLDDIKGDWQFTLKDGGKVHAEGHVRGLVTDNQLNLTGANGSFKLATDSAVAIGPWAALTGGDIQAGGQATFDIKGDFQSAQLNADIDAAVKGLFMKRGGTEAINPIDITMTGQARADEGHTTGNAVITSQAGNVDARFDYQADDTAPAFDAEQLVAAVMGKGSAVLPEVTFDADAAIDIPQLAAAVPSLLKIHPDVAIRKGKITLENIALRGGKNASLRGALRLTDLQATKGGQLLTVSPLSADIQAEMNGDKGLRVQRAELQADFAKVNASGTMTDLHAEFQTDLDKLYEQMGQLVEMPAEGLAGKVQGQLALSQGNAQTINVTLDVTGQGISYPSAQGKIDCGELTVAFVGEIDMGSAETTNAKGAQSIVASGKAQAQRLALDDQPLTDQPMEITWSKVAVHPARETIELTQVAIESQPLSASMQGSVKDYRSDCVVDITGQYKAVWEDVTALVHRLSPDTRDVFSLTGVGQSDFSLTGPVCAADVSPCFAGLRSTAEVNFSGGEVYGLSLGKGTITPVLRDAQIHLGNSRVTAGGGMLRLTDARVDLRQEPARLIIPGKLQMLDGVTLDEPFTHSMLSRVNPIFGNMTAVAGQISLELTDVDVPLGKQFKQSGVAGGRLDLSQLSAKPDGLLAELVRLAGGKTTRQTMAMSGLDFNLRNGRIHYDDLLVQLAEDYAVKFYGSVGFDDKLDLMASLPISESLLRRLGIADKLGGKMASLSAMRVEVPVVGTRNNPKLDLAGVKTDDLIKAAAESLINDQAGQLLENIFGPKK